MKNKIEILKIFILVILAVSFITGLILTSRLNKGNPLAFITPPDENQIFKQYVSITGEVTNPGVYEIQTDTRLLELIEMAGGFTEDASKDYINQLNLARILKDQENINIPSNHAASVEISSRININSATQQELMSLPGIGEATAKKIINSRPFQKIEDLLNVNGIGDAKFSKIKDLVEI